MPEQLFTSFIKENRPLSRELWRRAEPLGRIIGGVTRVEDLEWFAPHLLGERIAELGIEAPTLGRVRTASERDGGTRWNEDRSVGLPTRRYYVAVEVAGDSSFLQQWPDVSGTDLSAVDADVVAELGGLDAISHGSLEDAARFQRAGEMWELGADDDPREGRAARFSLYTYFDLTGEDEAAVARGELVLADLVRERRELIAPIVAAMREQVGRFLEVDLPEQLEEMIEAKRIQLINRQAVRDSLSFPKDWQGTEPQLEDSEDQPADVAAEPVAVEEQPAQPAATMGASQGVADEVELNPRSRLSRATFEDVLFSLRHWVNAVERTPTAFGGLVEDRISDLLAATWNATLPGAAREVYTRGGKSDIFIQADVLDPGRGPATVFICEAKWAHDHDTVRKALDPQLFGYLNVHDTSAVLLVLMRQKDFAGACATYGKSSKGSTATRARHRGRWTGGRSSSSSMTTGRSRYAPRLSTSPFLGAPAGSSAGVRPQSHALGTSWPFRVLYLTRGSGWWRKVGRLRRADRAADGYRATSVARSGRSPHECRIRRVPAEDQAHREVQNVGLHPVPAPALERQGR